jgi:hypothetical protein
MLASMIHLWATIRGISFPVKKSLFPVLLLLVGAQLWSLVVSFILFVLIHALLLFSPCVPLLPFCKALMAYPDVKIMASFVYRCLREAVPFHSRV